ncbi:hypothetical protein E2C01_079322 [Portunus trituberculatus]|uniref:Uncharacterized protein n=1 Tax=Portunus trituberculatus TaxID=210409 RepID=A0A5B7IJ85_PORTR|nr:hypothetical protein [Portunus trituberculatus]
MTGVVPVTSRQIHEQNQQNADNLSIFNKPSRVTRTSVSVYVRTSPLPPVTKANSEATPENHHHHHALKLPPPPPLPSAVLHLSLLLQVAIAITTTTTTTALSPAIAAISYLGG